MSVLSFWPMTREVEKSALRGVKLLVALCLWRQILEAGFSWREAACANAEKKNLSTSLWVNGRLVFWDAQRFDPQCLPFGLEGEKGNAAGQTLK